MSAPNPREAVRVVQESFADPEIEWVSEASVPEPQTYHGIDGVMEFFDGILDAFEYARQVPERFIDCGDQVLAFVRTEARGRTTGIEFKRTVGTPDHGARRQSGRARRDRAQALRAVLAPAHRRSRTTRTGAHRFTRHKLRPAGACRRRSARGADGARAPRRQSASSATSASSRSASSSPTAALPTTGSRGEAVRVRHGGAHLEGISKEPSSAAGIGPEPAL